MTQSTWFLNLLKMNFDGAVEEFDQNLICAVQPRLTQLNIGLDVDECGLLVTGTYLLKKRNGHLLQVRPDADFEAFDWIQVGGNKMLQPLLLLYEGLGVPVVTSTFLLPLHCPIDSARSFVWSTFHKNVQLALAAIRLNQPRVISWCQHIHTPPNQTRH